MSPVKIFVYGAPGSGKTTFSEKLKADLGYPLIEADYLRSTFAQKEKTIEEDPFVYAGTKEAYKYFGELNKENVIQGLESVRQSMWPYVQKEISKYAEELIMEAAFLDPGLISSLGRTFLVVTLDEEKHRSQYFNHRAKDQLQIETFKAVRIIQDYLLKESEQYNIEVVRN